MAAPVRMTASRSSRGNRDRVGHPLKGRSFDNNVPGFWMTRRQRRSFRVLARRLKIVGRKTSAEAAPSFNNGPAGHPTAIAIMSQDADSVRIRLIFMSWASVHSIFFGIPASNFANVKRTVGR